MNIDRVDILLEVYRATDVSELDFREEVKDELRKELNIGNKG